MARLPHRPFITPKDTDVSPPMMRSGTFPTSRVKAVGRLAVWVKMGLSFVGGAAWDRVRKRTNPMRGATRLRRAFEKAGGTFINIGQHLAMRIDLLPWPFCVELSKLRDLAPPFPLQQAVEIIERNTGKPLRETFRQFDPDPVLSTSAACVYQAFLANGEKVVVKVRRPKIGERLMADLKVLDWLFDVLEFLGILRAGFTRHLRQDFQASIAEELNFLSEARYQALFRDAAKKSGKSFFRSPRVQFELCSQDVIVEEFVSGLWLWELLAALEQNDTEVLTTARQMGIDPQIVAERLLWVNFWAFDEQLFFLADLHPDNVIIGPNNTLTFLDFSAVGSIKAETRQALQQIMYYARKRSPLGMAQATLVLLEPLPPIDVVSFTKTLEERYWQFLYALESKHTAWWEKTSVWLWTGLVEVGKEHGIAISPEVLRMIRASLLFDTLAARLHPQIDRIEEYHRFTKYRARQARKRVEKSMDNLIRQGTGSQVFLQFERISDTSERLFQQFRRFLSAPAFKFSAFMGKSIFAFSQMLKLLGQWLLVTIIAGGLAYGGGWLSAGQALGLRAIFAQLISNPFYQLAILLLMLVNFRALLFRLSDKDI